jgi:hypothetical protein
MSSFIRFSCSADGLHAVVDIQAFNARVREAQQWLGDRVLEDCKACMPLGSGNTGGLQQRSHTEDDGKRVVFPGPYARYLYYGKVMVDRETGKGPRKIPMSSGDYILRFRKGAKLIATNRALKYSDPQAVPEWFEHAKRKYEQLWIDGVNEIIGGK